MPQHQQQLLNEKYNNHSRRRVVPSCLSVSLSNLSVCHRIGRWDFGFFLRSKIQERQREPEPLGNIRFPTYIHQTPTPGRR